MKKKKNSGDLELENSSIDSEKSGVITFTIKNSDTISKKDFLSNNFKNDNELFEKENKEDTSQIIKEKSNNSYFFAFIIASLFAIFGAVLWILISFFGMNYTFAGSLMYFTSVIIVYGCVTGFDLAKGRKNIFSAIILVLISVIVLFFAEFISLSITVPIEKIESTKGYFKTIKTLIKIVFGNEIYITVFIKDFLIGLFFMLPVAVLRLKEFIIKKHE